MNKEELMDVLRNSLPSKRMLSVVNLCAIKVGNEYFVMKDRYKGVGSYVTDCLNEEELMDYKEIVVSPNHKYSELLHKNILIDKRILSRSGHMAIIEYLESEMN